MQLRELHLQLPFFGPRALREDVENQLRPIDHPAAAELLEIARLGGGQVVVEDDDRRVGPTRVLGKRFGLPSADERGRIGNGARLGRGEHDLRAGGAGEPGELVEQFVGISRNSPRLAGDETHKRRAIARQRVRHDPALAHP